MDWKNTFLSVFECLYHQSRRFEYASKLECFKQHFLCQFLGHEQKPGKLFFEYIVKDRRRITRLEAVVGVLLKEEEKFILEKYR